VVQSNYPSYAAKESVLPLDEFVAKDTEFRLDDFFPKMAEAMRISWKTRRAAERFFDDRDVLQQGTGLIAAMCHTRATIGPGTNISTSAGG
jgi:hypothetical protein